MSNAVRKVTVMTSEERIESVKNAVFGLNEVSKTINAAMLGDELGENYLDQFELKMNELLNVVADFTGRVMVGSMVK